MEISESKYQKLAAEYAKLRAQASVLKKAVVEEQTKCANFREQIRQKDSVIRRAEQEVDSLGFRNKQLEHRVSVLQDEIASREGRRRDKDHKRDKHHSNAADNCGDDLAQDAIIFEELQKKIMENAQLTSLIDDKVRELDLHTDRVKDLEHTLLKRNTEHGELEKRLRKDLEHLQIKNSELETKLVEAGSIHGSEDALSASGSDTTPIHNNHNHHHQQLNHSAFHSSSSNDDRIALEKEILHWRTQYEIAKLNEAFSSNNIENNCTSFSAAGIHITPSFAESKSVQRDSFKEPPAPPTKEQLIYNNFSKKYEELIKAKCIVESHVNSYEMESEHLQNCLENATQELKAKDEQMNSINQAIQLLEEDLATTRINYEEQITVLTEQVISLSEQLAACK